MGNVPGPDILDALPHRPPFRFMSEVLELRRGDYGSAVWRVTGEEAFFAGHFPARPVLPGVLIAEALAQLSGLVAFLEEDESESRRARSSNADESHGKLAHMDVRFDRSASPPTDILLRSRLSRVFGSLWQFDVKALEREHVIARGRVTLAQGSAGAESRGSDDKG